MSARSTSQTSALGAEPRRRVVYVTAGTVGAGHTVRGLALQKALGRACVAIELVMLVPDTPWCALDPQGSVTYRAEPELWRRAEQADTSDLARKIRALDPDLLVVDLFWVPLSQMSIEAPIWLLLRSVPPAWLQGPAGVPFEAGRYERVFAIEPAPGLDRFEHVGPLVFWDERVGESAERGQLAAMCRAPADGPLRLIMRAGIESDDSLLDERASAEAGQWSWLRLGAEERLFPVSHWLRRLQAGDVVVSGAGYNTFWEAHLLGYAEHVRWVALPRRIDDQSWRSSLKLESSGLKNGADELARRLLERLG